MKILITGATGFVGQHAALQLFQQGAEIAILTRDSTKIKNLDLKKIKVIEGSLEALAKCGQGIKDFNPDICLHLAWQGIPDYSYEVSKKNLNQSIAFIDFLLEETTCKKIIASGSCFEYGATTGSIIETANEENLSAIAWAKNSLKSYLNLRCNEKNLSWIWLRIFYVYGPGQRANALIPSLFRAAREDQAPPIRNPDNANDFVYISDVADAISAACNQNVESGIYNIGSGYLSKVTDMWALVQQCALSNVRSTLNDPSLHKQKNSDSVSIGGYANIEKAKVKLQWKPKIAPEKGVREFIAYLSDRDNKL